MEQNILIFIFKSSYFTFLNFRKVKLFALHLLAGIKKQLVNPIFDKVCSTQKYKQVKVELHYIGMRMCYYIIQIVITSLIQNRGSKYLAVQHREFEFYYVQNFIISTRCSLYIRYFQDFSIIFSDNCPRYSLPLRKYLTFRVEVGLLF